MKQQLKNIGLIVINLCLKFVFNRCVRNSILFSICMFDTALQKILSKFGHVQIQTVTHICVRIYTGISLKFFFFFPLNNESDRLINQKKKSLKRENYVGGWIYGSDIFVIPRSILDN